MRHRDVVTVTDAADRRQGVDLGEAFGVGDGHLLTARVGVGDHLAREFVAARQDRHLERLGDGIDGHRGAGSPTDDAAGTRR